MDFYTRDITGDDGKVGSSFVVVGLIGAIFAIAGVATHKFDKKSSKVVADTIAEPQLLPGDPAPR